MILIIWWSIFFLILYSYGNYLGCELSVIHYFLLLNTTCIILYHLCSYNMNYNTWTEICFYLYHSFWLCEICLFEFIINLNNATTTKKSDWWLYTHPLIKCLYYFSLQDSENILGDRIKRIKEVNYREKCDEKFTQLVNVREQGLTYSWAHQPPIDSSKCTAMQMIVVKNNGA